MAASLKGQIIAYFIDVARGQRVTLQKLCHVTGRDYNNQVQRAQVQHAINNVMRDRRNGLDRAPIDIATVVAGAVWQQVDYVAPTEPASVDPMPVSPAAPSAPEVDTEPVAAFGRRMGAEPTEVTFTMLGNDSNGQPVLRDVDGKLWTAWPL